MIGAPTLISAGEMFLKTLSDEEYTSYAINHRNAVELIKDGDWFMQCLCQYDPRHNFTIAEAAYLGIIKGIIKRESLYMTLVPCDSWANPDKERELNYSIIRRAGFDIEHNEDGTMDGIFSVESIDMTLLYDADIPSNPKIISKKLWGHVEIGTQSISKTAHVLQMGVPLLRLPYRINDKLNPFICVLHNINSTYAEDIDNAFS